MIETTVKILDPFATPDHLLVAFVGQRIMETARHITPEVSPRFVAQQVLSRLYQGDPSLCVVAIADNKGACVGHAVATLGVDSEGAFVNVSQLRADGNVGPALKQAIDEIERWARRQGATSMVLVTGGSDKSWEKELGFKVIRQAKLRSLEGDYAPLAL